MNKFSEAFEAARNAIDSGDFAGAIQDLKPKFRLLFGTDGPVVGQAKHLEILRHVIKSSKWELISTKGLTADRAGAKVIVDAAGAANKRQERAATLKMLRHLYHVKSAGGQAIWVYSPPVAYSKWIFDEVAGASDDALEAVLRKSEEEVYTAHQQGVMAAAIQEARAVCLAVVIKLGTPTPATTAVVRRYFGNSATTPEQLATITATLLAGYKRIANACNGGTIVISDEPLDRNSGGWKDWAFVYSTEAMSVIYLQGAWLAKADQVSPSNQSALYRCVRTVLHELSHKVVSTEDVVYGPKGLKPEGSTALTPEYALHNADSWAYFAVDVLGYLTGPDKANGEKSTTAILKAPIRALTTA